MPPRLPNRFEKNVFEKRIQLVETPESQDEIDSLKASYDVWDEAYQLLNQKANRSIGAPDEVDVPAELTERGMKLVYPVATPWVENPNKQSISYRLVGLKSLITDDLPRPVFEVPDEGIGVVFMPVGVQMRLKKDIPERKWPAEEIFDIYIIGGEGNRVGDLTSLVAPSVVAVEIREDGTEDEIEIWSPSIRFMDLRDTIGILKSRWSA